MKYLIIAAMPEEVSKLQYDLFDACDSYTKLNDNLSKYILHSKCCIPDEVSILITGVGMPNVTHSLIQLIRKFPEILDNVGTVINIGSAGARGNYKIGDLVLIDTVVNGDFDLTAFNYKLYEVPNFGTSIELCPLILRDNILRHGRCITMSRFLENSEFVKGNFLSYVVDMELYMIALILNDYTKFSLSSIKVITDVTDNTSVNEHVETLSNCSDTLCNYVYNLINGIK